MIKAMLRWIFAFIASGALASGAAHAQFYKGKTLTLLINFAPGGNADVEARVYQRFLGRHIPGDPSIVIQNAPGAGGLNAMNILGLSLSGKPDGLTAGYFTLNPIASILGDPGLKVSLADFTVIAGARGWDVAYGRKDMAPGISQPADLAHANHVFAGGYSRSSAHDTRLRLALDILGVPYTMVTGFPGTADVNKAMLQGELNFTSSSLPAYQTQVVPQIIDTGVGAPLFYVPIIGADGAATTNSSLDGQGFVPFTELYQKAFGHAPTGPKWDALMLLATLNTQMLRGVLLPAGAPPQAAAALRQAFGEITHDADFLREFERVVGEKPDLANEKELQPLFERMRSVDPGLKKVLQDSIDG